MLNSYEKDEHVQKIIAELQQDFKLHKNFSYVQGQLRRKGMIVVGNNT